MSFLLDTNVLIDANRDYYAMERVPEFWSWILHVGAQGKVKVPAEIYDELRTGTDVLAVWVKDHNRQLLLDEQVGGDLVADVVGRGYANDLNDVEVERVGQDPFLIAHALAHGGRCVVTTEASWPKRIRSNRHIPDVCRDLGVSCVDTFAFLRALDFTTGWNR